MLLSQVLRLADEALRSLRLVVQLLLAPDLAHAPNVVVQCPWLCAPEEFLLLFLVPLRLDRLSLVEFHVLVHARSQARPRNG